MSIEQVFSEYLTFAWGAFQFDMHMFSQWWMYVFMLIPVCAYFIFFLIKWWVITLPIWLPLAMILGSIKRILFSYPDKIKHESNKEIRN
jgi:hypothetical protein